MGITVNLKCLIHLLALSVVVPAMGQQIILNTQGEQIVLFPDGTWRYVTAADSVYRPDYNSTPNQGEHKTVEATESASLQSCRHFISQLTALEVDAENALRLAVDQKFTAEARLQNAKDNEVLIEADILAAVEEEYEQRIAAVAQTKKRHKAIERLLDQARGLEKMSIDKRKSALVKLTAEYRTLQAERPISEPIEASGKKSQVPVTIQQSDPGLSSRLPTRIVDYASEPYNCQYIEKSGSNKSQKRIILEDALLFTHTDPDLRPYFKDQELITCRGHLSLIGGQSFLTLEFLIASPYAAKNFGPLQSGALLRLKLIDGSFINLRNLQTDRGSINSYTGHTRYLGQYVLERKAQRALRKKEVDKMRVLWGTGFEDYDIYELDFFIDQLACIAKK